MVDLVRKTEKEKTIDEIYNQGSPQIPPFGAVGSFRRTILSGTFTVTDFANESNVPGLTITLSAGIWLAGYNITVEFENGTDGGLSQAGFKVRNINNNFIEGSAALAGHRVSGSSDTRMSINRIFPITILEGASETLRLRYESSSNGTPGILVYGLDVTAGIDNPDNQSNIWAIRIR